MQTNPMRRWAAGLLAVWAGILFTGAVDQTTADALKVQHLLETIAKKAPAPAGTERTAAISQRELNHYIAWRLTREKTTVVSGLTIELLGNDHVAGKMRFDAARLNLDVLLGEALDFDFKGVLVTRERAGRLDLISLSLCGQPVKPQVLDYVLAAAALNRESAAGRLEDWYALPAGVERIAVGKGRAVLYY